MFAVTQLPSKKVIVIALVWLAAIVTWSGSYSSRGGIGLSGLGTKVQGKNTNRLWPEQLVVKQASPRIPITDSPSLRDIQNSTLGFQKIYVLSMPNRRDKRDTLTLSAYLTGIDVEFVDGVNVTYFSRKEYPNNWNYEEPDGTIGCWRGHLDIYQKMLRDRVQTALIMEDDIDWDVMLKAQMTELARGTRYIQRASETDHSPYGDGWDIISTGHCGLWNKVNDDQEYWVIENDPTVPNKRHDTFWRKPNLTPAVLSGNQTRVVLSQGKFSCTASYAITLQGAARMIYDQQVLPNAAAIDMALGGLCKRMPYGYNSCLAAYPMITGTHRPAGDPAKYSDRTERVNKPFTKTSVSRGLMYPVRLNLGALLKGETVIKAQYQESAMFKEIDMQTLDMPRGRPVFVRASEYLNKELKSIDDLRAGAEEEEKESSAGLV